MDIFTQAKRSDIMSQVRSGNTKPELRVRSFLHKKGLRYSLHAKNLPGRPDLVFAKLRTAVFVHGCFWHQHADCKKATIPSTRREFWAEKLGKNVIRDERSIRALRELGWRSIVIWECEITDEHLMRVYLSLTPDDAK